MRKLFYSLLLCIFSGYSIYSQEVIDIISDEITITQDRIHLNVKEQSRQVQIISKEAIKLIPANNLPELLQYLTGIDVRRRGVNGVQADIVLRGGSFEQVLILLNGIRMNDAQTGHHSSYLPVDVTQIEKIEIVKGGASRIYGQNAFSGAINIITKANQNKGISAQVGYSSFNSIQSALNIALPVNDFHQNLSLAFQESDGYRYNTDNSNKQIFYQADTKLGSSKLDLMAGFTERKFGANGFYASPDFKDQYEEVQTSIAAGKLTIALNENTFLTPKLSWRRNQDMYLFLRNNPAFYRNMHIGNTINGELHLNNKSNLGSLGLGLDIASQKIRSNNLGGHERMIYGIFAEQNFKLAGDRVSLTTGFYGQYIPDLESTKIYPGIDLGYQLSDDIRLFATTGYNNRIPSYTDLYYNSPSEQGNPNLLPESAWDSDLGISFKSGIFKLDASIFRRVSQNVIDWGKDSLTQKKWVVNNLNGLTTNGIELAAVVNFTDNVNVSIQYTYIDNNLSSDGNSVSRYVLDNLKHQLSTGVNTSWLDKKLTVGVFMRYNERSTPTVFASLDGFSSHFLMDGRVSYRLGSFILGFNANNITNTIYRETNLVPMPGSWFGVNLNYNWVQKN